MSESRHPTAEAAKKAGWYSRRHETFESHQAAVDAHPYTGGRKNRLRLLGRPPDQRFVSY